MAPLTCCKTCGSSEWDTENHERVCTNCGDVQESLEELLCNLPDHGTVLDTNRNKNYEANQRLTGRIRGETQSSSARKNVNTEKVLDEIGRKVKLLVKNADALHEVTELVSQVVKSCKKRLTSDKKLGLAGACVYYVSAKYRLGLSLTSICKELGIKLKVINVSLRQVKEIMPNYEFERPNMKDLVTKYIDELSPKHCDITSLNIDNLGTVTSLKTLPFITNEDKGVLTNRVLLLVDLFEATHPYNQPNPQTLIIAVIYHAWKSLDTFKLIAEQLHSSKNISPSEEQQRQIHRMKNLISYEKFCSAFDIRYSSNGYKIVREIQGSLLTLGRYMGNVNKLNLPWFLNDIIDNSSDLMKEHKRCTKNHHQTTSKSATKNPDSETLSCTTSESSKQHDNQDMPTAISS